MRNDLAIAALASAVVHAGVLLVLGIAVVPPQVVNRGDRGTLVVLMATTHLPEPSPEPHREPHPEPRPEIDPPTGTVMPDLAGDLVGDLVVGWRAVAAAPRVEAPPLRDGALAVAAAPRAGPVEIAADRARRIDPVRVPVPAARRPDVRPRAVTREPETPVTRETPRETRGRQPEPLVNPAPSYPRLARARGYQGMVELRVRVLASGATGEVRLKRSSGYGVLDQAAIRAVRRWTFRPGRAGATPIDTWVDVPVEFRLED